MREHSRPSDVIKQIAPMCTPVVIDQGDRDGSRRKDVIFSADSKALSAPEASVRLLNCPNSGPPDGPISAHQ